MGGLPLGILLYDSIMDVKTVPPEKKHEFIFLMALSALLMLGFIFVVIPLWLGLTIMVMLPVRLTLCGSKWYLYLMGWYRDHWYEQLPRLEHKGIKDAFLTGLGAGMMTVLGTPRQKNNYKRILRWGYNRGTLPQEILIMLKAAGGIHEEVVCELEADIQFQELILTQTSQCIEFVAQQMLSNDPRVVLELEQLLSAAAQLENNAGLFALTSSRHRSPGSCWFMRSGRSCGKREGSVRQRSFWTLCSYSSCICSDRQWVVRVSVITRCNFNNLRESGSQHVSLNVTIFYTILAPKSCYIRVTAWQS